LHGKNILPREGLGGQDGCGTAALMEETALPVTEAGPVDFRALRRFASI
jgi:hypothetical protein